MLCLRPRRARGGLARLRDTAAPLLLLRHLRRAHHRSSPILASSSIPRTLSIHLSHLSARPNVRHPSRILHTNRVPYPAAYRRPRVGRSLCTRLGSRSGGWTHSRRADRTGSRSTTTIGCNSLAIATSPSPSPSPSNRIATTTADNPVEPRPIALLLHRRRRPGGTTGDCRGRSGPGCTEGGSGALRSCGEAIRGGCGEEEGEGEAQPVARGRG